MLLFLRCTTFIGVSVEFVAAVAWLAELFPDPKQREAVLGYTQAFSSVGGLLVSAAYYLAVTYGNRCRRSRAATRPWRYTLISGVIPAIPLIIIRPFLPESPVWQEKKSKGTLKRPSFAELFRPEFRRTTLITRAHVRVQLSARRSARSSICRASCPACRKWRTCPGRQQEQIVSKVQFLQEMGGLVGRFILAVLAVRIVSRRQAAARLPGSRTVHRAVRVLLSGDAQPGHVQIGIFMAGLLTVAQFSFWGNYLPRVYPTYLRGTGESFAANIGGRMIGTSAALLTTQLANTMPLALAAAV